MAKGFDLDSEIPSFYGTTKGTFRDALERKEAFVKKEHSYITGKDSYSLYFKTKDSSKSPFSYVVNGRQARKYVEDSTGHLKDL